MAVCEWSCRASETDQLKVEYGWKDLGIRPSRYEPDTIVHLLGHFGPRSKAVSWGVVPALVYINYPEIERGGNIIVSFKFNVGHRRCGIAPSRIDRTPLAVN